MKLLLIVIIAIDEVERNVKENEQVKIVRVGIWELMKSEVESERDSKIARKWRTERVSLGSENYCHKEMNIVSQLSDQSPL